MCDSFTLKSCSDDATLTFSGLSSHGLEPRDETTFRVTLESTPVRTTLDVYDRQVRRWVSYFAGLAADWTGWEGGREMETVDHELRIVCSYDRGGHITARVFLRSISEGWRVEYPLQLEAGQLEDIARRARRYFG